MLFRSLFDEHGIPFARISLSGRLDQLWARQSDGQSADLRRAARPPRLRLQRRQELGRPEGYQIPSWCGSGRGYSRPISVYDNQGRRIATVK